MGTNTTWSIPIGATGEVLRYNAIGKYDAAKRLGFHLDGDEAADYSIDVGVDANGDGTVKWFDDYATYSSKSSIHDGWDWSEQWLRIRVTTAASSGSEATVYLSEVGYW